MNVTEFLARLTGVKKCGDGWQARCPAHDDRKASLSISQGDKQPIVVKCHAGCSTESIVAAMGLKVSELSTPQPKVNSHMKPRIIAAYPYQDEMGNVLFETVRYEPKDFKQRRPDPAKPGKWIWNLKGVRRVLYRLPELKAAIANGQTIYLVAGEKDVGTMVQHGFTATCNPLGEKKDGSSWLPEYTETLRGAASIIVIADKDETGRAHARIVASRVRAVVLSLKLIELPDVNGKPVKDASDFFAAGGTAEQLTALVESVPQWRPQGAPAEDHPPQHGSGNQGDERDDTAASARLVAIALKGIELFHGRDKTRYGRVRIGGHVEVWPLKGQDAKEWLCGTYFNTTGKAINSAALGDAINVLCCKARFGGPCVDVWMRVAPFGEGLVIDLGDPDWRAVVVDKDGWRVVDEHPVMFVRPATMLALPVPKPGVRADFGRLWQYLNVTPAQRPLIIGWLLAAYHPKGPYPILPLSGQQGSAKSLGLRLLRMLVDPSTVELPSAPKDERDLIVSARSRRLLAFDNLSSMPAGLADALCRVATGGGLSVRQLYSDGEEFAISIKRPVAFNGIPDLLARGDLAERSIRVELSPIDETARRDEDEILNAFERDAPHIFAGLLEGLSACIRDYRNVKLARRPRMADAARWITAGESALGFPQGSFLNAFFENQADSARMVIEASPIGPPLLGLITQGEVIECSPSDLLARLNAVADEAVRRDSHWPRQAHNLSAALKRLAPALKQSGVLVSFTRTRDTRIVQISRSGKSASPASPDSPQAECDAGDAIPATPTPTSTPTNLVEELI